MNTNAHCHVHVLAAYYVQGVSTSFHAVDLNPATAPFKNEAMHCIQRSHSVPGD